MLGLTIFFTKSLAWLNVVSDHGMLGYGLRVRLIPTELSHDHGQLTMQKWINDHSTTTGCRDIGIKLCISPFGCTEGEGGQGRVVGPYPLWDSVSGSLVRWEVWSIPSPNIFESGVARCSLVRCFIGLQSHSTRSVLPFQKLHTQRCLCYAIRWLYWLHGQQQEKTDIYCVRVHTYASAVLL